MFHLLEGFQDFKILFNSDSKQYIVKKVGSDFCFRIQETQIYGK